MKKLIFLFVLTTFGLIAFAQSDIVQEKSKDDFEKMSFEVSLNTNNYLPLEPIFAKFKFSNKTGDSLTADSPNFLQETKIKFKLKGQSREINSLSSVNAGGIRFPSTFKPEAFYEKEELLGSSVGWYLAEPGNYELQFVLRSSDGAKMLESNPIEIEIKHPEGNNKEAFDFLSKHKDFFGQSTWVVSNKKDKTLLEDFVKNYGQSVYGELAISSLGNYYLAYNELDKAKVEFEKIASSKNDFISEAAKKSLVDIETKIKNLERSKQNHD